MIDIHTHILPGIDDGAENITQAVEMCRIAAVMGCTELVATPHQRAPRWWNTEPIRLKRLLRKVREHVGDRPKLHLGAEIRVSSDLLETLDRLADSGVLPLADTSYLLLELSRRGQGPGPEEVTQKALQAGWRPVIAHPEFIPALLGDIPRTASLVEAGARLQITAMSVTGDFGDQVQQFVWELLDADLAHFLASDTHDTQLRPPGLQEARAVFSSRWGADLFKKLTVENPRALLKDEQIAVGNAPATGPKVLGS